MHLERELKFLGVNLKETGRRLREVGGQSLGRYFETNVVFDSPDRALKRQGMLLRLREKEGEAVLTVKRPPENAESSGLKVFEEIETGVGDFNAMRESLLAVGFVEVFGYEKIREKWRYGECVICLDTLPFGDFIEIEGTEEMVAACAGDLGLEDCKTSTETYYRLNIQYRRDNGLPPDENFRFSEAERADLVRLLGKDCPVPSTAG